MANVARNFYVYELRYKGTPLYVGKGSGNRAIVHSKYGVLYRRFRNDRIPVSEIQTRLVRRFNNEATAFEFESALITRYGRVVNNSGTLYNLRIRGGGQKQAAINHSSLSRIRKRRSINAKKAWKSNSLMARRQRIKVRSMWRNPEYRRRVSENNRRVMLQRWKDPEFARHISEVTTQRNKLLMKIIKRDKSGRFIKGRKK